MSGIFITKAKAKSPELHIAMSEKLCLQWNDFKANVNSAFGRLRDDKEFTDVTLVCEDGQHLEAHKLILSASSPLFEKILQNGKHPHPLIYLKGFKSKDFEAILDFLYFGEANVYQENLDSFLAIAEELKLKGLTDQTSSDLLEMHKNPENPKPVKTSKEFSSTTEKVSGALAIRDEFSLEFQALDEKVKSLMEKGQNMIPHGTEKNGKPRRTYASVCKICGKEGVFNIMRNHIEANHLEGISIPCDYCDKAFGARQNLSRHKAKCHK